MKKEIKEEVVPCEICGHSVIHNEYGLYQDCPQCGWRRGGDNVELERQWGGQLSHARVAVARERAIQTGFAVQSRF